MKKILFLTTRLVYPINDGRKVVLYNYCKGLSELHNCEVRLFTIGETNNNIKQPDFISKVYYGNLPDKIEKIKNLVIKSLILNDWPLQVSLYFSKKTKKELYEVIENYNPDIVICDMARTAEYLKDLNIKDYNKILDMDDLLSKRYFRQIQSNNYGNNSIGAYSEKIPKILRSFLSVRSLMKTVLTKEARLLRTYEVSIANHYSSVVFVSPIEATEFNKSSGENKAIDITIGVDSNFFHKNDNLIEVPKSIVFIGNMYVGHNKDSVNIFLDKIFPLIQEEIPDVTFRIVGRCSKQYKDKFSSIDNVEVTGEVSDLKSYVQDCCVSVAPLAYGTGIKTKILESMAMGVAVVTNNIGAEGLEVEDGKEIVIENNNEMMAKRIIELITNNKLRLEIASNGQAYVNKNHDWGKILKRFKLLIG